MTEHLARLTAALADRYRLDRELGAGGSELPVADAVRILRDLADAMA